MLLACREPEALMKLIKHWDLAQPHFPSLKHRPWLHHSGRSLCVLGEERLGVSFDLQTALFFFSRGGNELVYKKYDKMSSWFSLMFLLLAALWIWTGSPGSSLYDSKPHPVIEEWSALLSSLFIDTVDSALHDLSFLPPIIQLRNPIYDTPNLTQIEFPVSVSFKDSTMAASISSLMVLT